MPFFVSARPSRQRACACLLGIILMIGLPAQPLSAGAIDVTELSLEDLLHVRVTSASRKEESLFGASAAIYSISGPDIHRAGALDLPEAIRLAPGVQVGRINESDVALSPRGFNDISANKLLALIDGRSIYSPLFGGGQWRKHDIVMDDIERIEVIRGPGATLWGANAVNGVINVTTKSAHDTIGTLVSLKFGDQLERGATFRHGFSIDGAPMPGFTPRRFGAPISRRPAPAPAIHSTPLSPVFGWITGPAATPRSPCSATGAPAAPTARAPPTRSFRPT